MTAKERKGLPLAGQEARILLTSRCNYRCIFCHAEGIGDVTETRWESDQRATLDIVDQALALGCRDITLTGGEPLLEPDLALEAIRRVARTTADATVTIVTNAALLKDEWLAEAAPSGNLRFNVSLHTEDPDAYCEVTGQSGFSIADIRRNLSLLRGRRIPFKINAVALRRLAEPEAVASLCAFAEREGAAALKILELLIMEQSESLFPDFLALESIEKRLSKEFQFVRQTRRRREFRRPDSPFTVELQKCRCRGGCRNCLTETTANMSSAGSYWPCFEACEKNYRVADRNLAEALAAGYTVLEQMAGEYGDGSPSLVKSTTLIARRREVFFQVGDDATRRKILSFGRKTSVLDFEDFYFKPAHPDDRRSGRQAKIRVHAGNPDNAILVLSTVWLEREGNDLPVHATLFLEDRFTPMTAVADRLERMLDHLGWGNTARVLLEGSEYLSPQGSVFSLCRVGVSGTWLLRIDLDSPGGLDMAIQTNALSGCLPVSMPLPEFYAIYSRTGGLASCKSGSYSSHSP